MSAQPETPETLQQTQIRAAKNQSLFREVNERIEAISQAHETNGEILCECANRECVATIPLTPDEYEAVRSFPTQFFVVPGHVVPQIERVVGETARYVVVEKFGKAGSTAVRLDPRGRTGPSASPRM